MERNRCKNGEGGQSTIVQRKWEVFAKKNRCKDREGGYRMQERWESAAIKKSKQD